MTSHNRRAKSYFTTEDTKSAEVKNISFQISVSFVISVVRSKWRPKI